MAICPNCVEKLVKDRKRLGKTSNWLVCPYVDTEPERHMRLWIKRWRRLGIPSTKIGWIGKEKVLAINI